MRSTGAISLWVRSQVRRDWRSLVLIALSVALTAGLAMTAGIGARRAGSAFDRFARRTRAPDVLAQVPVDDGEAALAAVRSRPGVEAAALMGFMMVAPEDDLPEGAGPSAAFVGLSPGFGTSVYRPLILDGRAADPARADELTINPAMARSTGLRPGDQVVLVSPPSEVRQPATVVGIQIGVLDLALNTGSPLALLTPAFGARWFDVSLAELPPDDRANYPKVVLAIVPDARDRAALTADGFFDARGTSEVTDGLAAQRTAFGVLAVAAATGVLLAAGQTLSRRVRRDADQLPVLATLGLTPRQRQVAAAVAPLGAATGGLVAAPVVASLFSPLVATGLAGRLEAGHPFVVDLTVMVLGAMAGVAVLAATTWLAVHRSATRRTTGRPHPAPVALPGPAGRFGGRVTAGWATPSARSTARSHVAGVAVAIAAVTGVAVWSGAARHLVSTPARYGVTWDATIAPPLDEQFTFDPTALDVASERLEGSAIGTMVARIDAGMYDNGRIEVAEIDRNGGGWWPTTISGRAPVADDEVTIGGLMSERFGVGDTIDVGGQTLHVVGQHVVPVLSNGEFGGSIAMTSGAVPGLELGSPNTQLLVRLAPGATVDDLRRIAGTGLAVRGPVGPPGDLVNLGLLGSLDEILLATCVALGLAMFANGLILATRARRRDHATLRALGARRRTIAGSVAWHGGLVALAGTCVGVPVGSVLGRTVWRRTAEGMGVGPDLWRWGVVAATVTALTVAVATIVVAGLGAVAARSHGAQRAE